MANDRTDLAAFLQEVAESEHQIRHPAAFKHVADLAGFDVTKGKSRVVTKDREAPEPEKPASE